MGSSNDPNGDHNDENKDGNNSYAMPENEVELDVKFVFLLKRRSKFFFSFRI